MLAFTGFGARLRGLGLLLRNNRNYVYDEVGWRGWWPLGDVPEAICPGSRGRIIVSAWCLAMNGAAGMTAATVSRDHL